MHACLALDNGDAAEHKVQVADLCGRTDDKRGAGVGNGLAVRAKRCRLENQPTRSG